MSDKRVKFGLIGYGLFGSHHADAIANCGHAELTAIAVRSDASQQLARDAHPTADVLGDYRRLIDRDDIEVVSVVAPNQLHFEIAKAVLEAGKHLLLEKPMALRVEHCDELVALADANKLVLAVGHELRLSSLWGGVKKLIDAGAIGDPLHVLIELSRFPYRPGSQGWRYDLDRVGSWILEEPIHFFDLARWYLSSRGEPTSVYARANSRHPDNPKLLDNFSAIVNFNGAYAVISQTLAAFGHHQTGKISGTEGTIWAWWSAADARSDKPTFGLRYGLGDDVTEMTFDKPTGELLELADEVAAVARCVREGTPPPCTAVDGRWSTLLCLAAQRAVDRETPVSIEEFVAN
ncbi:MAG: Gfo/Idh/MocA family oxidoreductase [Planctomycetota bacterium]|nr:Gfo/Idh/MocA family oxidoreductase [Planctomycetota bacterium]